MKFKIKDDKTLTDKTKREKLSNCENRNEMYEL